MFHVYVQKTRSSSFCIPSIAWQLQKRAFVLVYLYYSDAETLSVGTWCKEPCVWSTRLTETDPAWIH